MSLESLESRDLLAADLVFQMPTTGVYDLSVQSGELVIQDATGSTLVQHAANDVATLTVLGTAGNDTLRILETAEGLPSFSGDTGFQLSSFLSSGLANAAGNQDVGLRFEAGAGDDVLELATSGQQVSYFAGQADANDPTQKRGNVNVADQFTLSFDGLTPQVIPSTGGTLLVDASADPDTTTLTIRDDETDLAGAGGMMVTGDGGFETVFFNGFTEIIVVGGDGSETIILESFDPNTSLTTLTVNGDNSTDSDASSDELVVLSLPVGITANLLGGGGDDIFTLDQTGGATDLGPIVIDGGAEVLGDSFQFTGDDVVGVTIRPDTTGGLNAVEYGSNSLTYQNIEVPLFGAVSQATYITPNEVDDFVLQELSAGGAPVLTFFGTSDGVEIDGPIFANVPVLTFDTGTNDGALGADIVVFDVFDTPQGIGQVNLVTGAFDDVIVASSVAGNVTLNVDGGAGNDVVEIGTADFGVNGIFGVVTTTGGDNDVAATWDDSVTAAGSTFEISNPVGDTLRVIDFITNFDSEYVVSETAFEAVGVAPFGYTGIETLELITGQASNLINVLGTPDGSTLRVQAANSVDVVNIENTGAGGLVDISTFGADDQVTINQTGAGSFIRFDTNVGEDNVAIEGSGDGGGIGFSLGDDNDTAFVNAAGASSTIAIQGDAGVDVLRFAVSSNGTNVELSGGTEDDLVVVDPVAFGQNVRVSGDEGDDSFTIQETTDAQADDVYALDSVAATKVVGDVSLAISHTAFETVGLFSGAGNDVVEVTPDTSLRFILDGGTPTGVVDGDELQIVEDGFTNVVIVAEQGADAGTVTADGTGTLVSFREIEILPTDPVEPPDPPAGDRFEGNETIATATPLGSEAILTLRDLDLHVADDIDVYAITAHDTGMLIINSLFSHVDGNIDMRLVDAGGQVLGVSGSITDNETVVIPVVSQETYFIEVTSPSDALNEYTLEIENFASPTATSVSLDAASDTGISDSDGITADFTPRFLIQADLSEFANMGIPILSSAEARAGEDGAAVVVRFTDQFTGETESDFANPVGTSNTLWEYEVLGEGLLDGDYLIGASVVIVDGQRPAPEVGDTELSPFLEILIDSFPPDVSVPVVAPAFDTGMDGTDQVTNRNELLVTGVATPFSTITLVASDETGQGFLPVGTTATDADGNWSVTTELLADGNHVFVAGAESVSGLLTISDPTGVFVVDTVQPNVAGISLTSQSDSGRFDNDLITNDVRPIVSLQVADVGESSFPNDLKYRLFLTPDGSGSEILVGDSFGETGGFVDAGQYTPQISLPSGAGLPDGTHSLRLEVEDRAGNVLQGETLTFTIDTTAPQKSFGAADVVGDGLLAESDTGEPGDRITSDTTPTFWGFAEIGTALDFFVRDANDALISIGQTSSSDGNWQLTSFVDLTDDRFDFDSNLREIVMRGTDAAGNVSADMGLTISIEIVGPDAPRTGADIGVWAGGVVNVDANGDFESNSVNEDGIFEDLVYRIGFVSDDIFAGNFVANPNSLADGFDKVAAYGDVGISYHDRQFRFLIDANNDGVVNTEDGDIVVHTDRDINGLPVAGRFDVNDGNGDEVGVFDGQAWWIDRTHSFQPNFRIVSELRGYPIVGDFDADGFDDLATYNEDHNRFEFDLTNGERRGWDGQMDTFFNFEYAGKRDRPIAADFDDDGIDDIGLWAPDVNTVSPDTTGEWFILVSGGESILNRIEPVQDGAPGVQTVSFNAGSDIYAHFGSDYSLPIAGDFGMPDGVIQTLTVDPVAPLHNVAMPNDVNNDGHVSPLDALAVINVLNADSASASLFADTDGDGAVSPLDAISIINQLDTMIASRAAFASREALSNAVVNEPVSLPQIAEVDSQVIHQAADGASHEVVLSNWQRSTVSASVFAPSVSSEAEDNSNDGLFELLATNLLESNQR